MASVKILRAFSIRQPWAQALVDGAFPVILRSVATNHRGWVGVLAPSTLDPNAAPRDLDLPKKAIVGAASIADCVSVTQSPKYYLHEQFGREFADFYPDHFLPQYKVHAWNIDKVVMAEKPIPVDNITMVWTKMTATVSGKIKQIGE